MAVVPLAIVMVMVELLNRRMAMQQRNRIGSRRTLNSISIVMILHYNTTLTPSSKAMYSGTKYYDTHIEFHSLFLDVSSTDV